MEAHDSDPNNRKSAETWLVIYVEDVNDNSPVINVDFVLESSENTGMSQTLNSRIHDSLYC